MGSPQSVTFGYEIGVEFESKHRYDFDITDAVQSWVSDATAKSKGIIFKATNALESGSANTYRTIASYNRSSNKPSLSVTYVSGLGALNHTSIDVDEGSTVALHVSGISAQITWSSSNSSIATVNSNGVVTGVRAGQVTITASAAGYTPKTCIVYVTIPDGVYRIKNNYSNLYLGVSDSSTTSGAAVTQQSVQNEGVAYLSQLWNISYIGDGYYTFTPMHKLNYGLYLNSTSVVSSSIGFNTSLATTHVLARWRVRYSSNGYILQCINGITYTIAPTGYTSAVDAAITAHSTLSSATAYRWTLSKVKGVFLYEPYSYVGIPSGSTVDMELGTSSVLAGTLISGGSSVSWSVSNPYNASINSSTGRFTPQRRGTHTISAVALIDDDVHQAVLNVKAKEIIYITNYYDNSLNIDTTLLSYIDDAVDFLNTIYEDNFYLHFEMDGVPSHYTNAAVDICPFGYSDDCSSSPLSCGDDCRSHHKNIHRIAQELYSNEWTQNHVVVTWSNSEDNVFCIHSGVDSNLDGIVDDYCHNALDFLGVVITPTNRTIPLPVIQVFSINRNFSLQMQADQYEEMHLMCITLAHEIAHTLGLREVATGSYPEAPNHNGNDAARCIMSYLEPNKYEEIYNAGQTALCSFCSNKIRLLLQANSNVYEE